MKIEIIARQLTDSVVKGDIETAREKARIIAESAGNANEALDAILEGYTIVKDLHSVGEYDDDRLSASSASVSAALDALAPELSSAQERYGLRAAVGPVTEAENDVLSALVAAMLKAAGYDAADLSRCKTPKELLRNAEQSSSRLLIVRFFANSTRSDLQAFAEEVENGGFRGKFEMIALGTGDPSLLNESSLFSGVAKDPLEAVEKAAELLLKSKRS